MGLYRVDKTKKPIDRKKIADYLAESDSQSSTPTTGNSVNPINLLSTPMMSSSNNLLLSRVIQGRLQKDYFHAQLRFIRGLTAISTMLVNLRLLDKDLKNFALRFALKKLNRSKDFLKGVYIPIFSPKGIPYRVVRIPHAEALCLNSRDRVPYMLNLEVVSGYIEQNHAKTFNDKRKIKTEKKSSSSSRKHSMEGEQEQQMEYKVTKLVDTINIVDEWVFLDSGDEKDPVLETAFGPNWETRKERLRQASPMGHVVGWDLISVIVKSGDDLRQEQLAMQLISVFHEVFTEEGLPLWLRPYMVLATSRDAGLIETVHDAISIHGLKKSLGVDSLAGYFTHAYGSSESPRYKKVQSNFVESLAAYSLVCYLLQIKDRHNGNILIDREGHIIHIDYGFMLSSSPGNLQFEKAPFKLPLEFVELMGGRDGDMFEIYFKSLIHCGFMAVRKHYKKILSLVELMIHAGGSQMACFQLGEETITNLKLRFALNISDEEMIKYTAALVNESAANWRTNVYDHYQYFSNGIL